MAARTVTRSLKDVIERQLLVRNVKSVKVNYSQVGPGQTGARKFITQHFPVIKYHNMGVQMAIDKSETPIVPKIVVERQSGDLFEQEIEGMHSDDILALFLKEFEV